MKNLFYELTIKSVKDNKIRIATTLIGVVISVALITNIVFTASSVYHFMIEDIKDRFGDWSIQIENMEGKVKETADKRGYDRGQMTGVSYAYIDGSVNPDKPFMYIVSMDDKMKQLSNFKIKEGRMPRRANEIVIPEHVLTNAGVRIDVGDKWRIDEGYRVNIVNGEELTQKDHYLSKREVFIKAREKTYNVVGICQRLSVESYMAAGYTAITVPQKGVLHIKDTFFKSSEYMRVQKVLSKYYVKPNTIKENDTLLKAQGYVDGESSVGNLIILATMLIVFIGICGFLLMYNTFTFSLREHEQAYRILASAGATKRQLRKALVYEGLFIGFIGITVGMIVGSITTYALISFFGDDVISIFTTYVNGELTYQVGKKWIIVAFCISLGMVLLSIILPAYRTGRIKPIKNYHLDEISSEARRKLGRVNIFKKGFFSIETKLALKNYRKNSKIYRYPIVSMTLSIVLFLSVGTIGSYMDRIMDSLESPEISYDISYMSKSLGEAEKAFVHLSTVEGVEECTNFNFSKSSMEINGEVKDTIFYIMDDDTFEKYLKLNKIKSDGYFDPKAPKTLALSYITKYDDKASKFDREEIPKEERQGSYKGKIPGIKQPIVIGKYISNVPENSMLEIGKWVVIMSKSAGQNLKINNDLISFEGCAYFKVKDNSKTYSTMEDVCKKNGLATDYLVNMEKERENINSTMMIIEYFSYTFMLLISIIAVVNIFNTINADLGMRQLEFATLLSIGMSKKSLDKMIYMECLLLGVKTLLYALPLTEIGLYLLIKHSKMNSIFGYIFPWKSTILSIIVLFATVVAIMIYGTYKMDQKNSSQTLKNWK